MSEIILPEGITLPKPVQSVDSPPDGATSEQLASMVPTPTGWKVLCIVPDQQATFDGSSLLKAASFMRDEETATAVLFVLKVGPDAYKDPNKFSAPWCKEGDFVLVRTYSGTRFKIHGKEFRLLNDDQIEAVVADPRGVTRA